MRPPAVEGRRTLSGGSTVNLIDCDLPVVTRRMPGELRCELRLSAGVLVGEAPARWVHAGWRRQRNGIPRRRSPGTANPDRGDLDPAAKAATEQHV